MRVNKTFLKLKLLSIFVSIQKNCIIEALQQLVVNNLLYENIQINYYLLKTQKAKYSYSSIIANIVGYNSNQYKYEDYTIDLNDSNFENNLNSTIRASSIDGNYINSSYVYSDIDNQ